MTEGLAQDDSNEAQKDKEIDALLRRLGRRWSAHFIALFHTGSASMVGAVGAVPSHPDAAVPALLDSYVSAARRLASTVADIEFVSLAHQGDGSTILLREVAAEWILMVVLREGGPAIETIRQADVGVAELRRVVTRESMRTEGSRSHEVGLDWIRAAEAEIDRTFAEGT